MDTLLTKFCEEFVREVRPLLVPLGRTADALGASHHDTTDGNGTDGDVNGKRAVREEFLDLHHQIELLSNKVAEQQAYVLIFGPLKSGKSTLMNAISSTYVSEVSSLPAYPCMVYVSHARAKQYTATHYDGTVKTFAGAEDMQAYVDDAHTKLAARIRQNETTGRDFDPLHNFPEAVRRIDVRFPIKVLEPSRAVLVDTPGLYTTMKFGYDRMTRDFQNAAACAVFVVRADNLFFDQVFSEFAKLLDLFSRVFLVVNTDSRKLDVGPDGALVPSLEQADPKRIVDAFEKLTMSASLKKAVDEGRLRIYPVDLLQAASERLQAGNRTAPAPTTKTASSTKKGNEFDRFFGDLTEYLNSPDYLVAFLGDSLRRAVNLMGEIEATCKSPALGKIEQRIAAIDAQRETLEKRLRTAKRLRASDWKTGFEWLKQDSRRVLDDMTEELDKTYRARVGKRVHGWFETDDSLQSLVDKNVVPLLEEHQREVVAALGQELDQRLIAGQAGLRVSREVAEMLRDVDIDLGALGRTAFRETDPAAYVTRPAAPLLAHQVHVRRTTVDKLLLRSSAKLGRKFFGPPEAPSKPIPRQIKRKRLGDSAHQQIHTAVSSYERGFFVGAKNRVHQGMLEEYSSRVQEAFANKLLAIRRSTEAELATLARERDACRGVAEPLADLRQCSKDAKTAVQNLSEHYSKMNVYMLTKPLDPKVEIPTLGSPRGEAAQRPNRASTPSATVKLPKNAPRKS